MRGRGSGVRRGAADVRRWIDFPVVNNREIFSPCPMPSTHKGLFPSPVEPNRAMPNYYEGNMVATGLRFGLVVSRWNAFITERLLEGALDTIKRHGADTDTVDVARVPGTFEIPLVAQRMAASGRYDAVICLGCLIRGSTPHFDYIAGECSKGIAQAMLQTGIPVTFGVLTCDTIEQAIERAGTKAGNKGGEAAGAAIEMAGLIRGLPSGPDKGKKDK